MTSEEFEQCDKTRYHGILKGKITWKPNEGKTSVRDRSGKFYWIRKDDPELPGKLASGEWIAAFTNMVPIIEVATGKRFSVPTDDPRIVSGEYRYVSKGMATVRPKDGGKAFQVPKDDPRIASGELVNILHGRIHVVDINGKTLKVYPDDPRILSGEFRIKEINKKKIRIKPVGTTGRGFFVFYDDPRASDPAYLHGSECRSRGSKKTGRRETNAYDKDGKICVIPAGHPGLKDGTYRHVNAGMVTVRELATGATLRVSKDDPRVISGELVSVNTARVRVIDPNGIERRVLPDDPRLLTGELVPKVLKRGRV